MCPQGDLRPIGSSDECIYNTILRGRAGGSHSKPPSTTHHSPHHRTPVFHQHDSPAPRQPQRVAAPSSFIHSSHKTQDTFAAGPAEGTVGQLGATSLEEKAPRQTKSSPLLPQALPHRLGRSAPVPRDPAGIPASHDSVRVCVQALGGASHQTHCGVLRRQWTARGDPLPVLPHQRAALQALPPHPPHPQGVLQERGQGLQSHGDRHSPRQGGRVHHRVTRGQEQEVGGDLAASVQRGGGVLQRWPRASSSSQSTPKTHRQKTRPPWTRSGSRSSRAAVPSR